MAANMTHDLVETAPGKHCSECGTFRTRAEQAEAEVKRLKDLRDKASSKFLGVYEHMTWNGYVDVEDHEAIESIGWCLKQMRADGI